jgi:hypothetical protein
MRAMANSLTGIGHTRVGAIVYHAHGLRERAGAAARSRALAWVASAIGAEPRKAALYAGHQLRIRPDFLSTKKE